MAVAGKHICPQCFYENPLHIEDCQFCGWNMAQEPDDATKFITQHLVTDGASPTQIASTDQQAQHQQSDNQGESGPNEPTHTFNLTGSLAHFEVSQIIGKGGMGAVYRATDHTLEREVAIKALKANRNLDQIGRDLLLEEARTICKLNHPNIVTVYDVARGDDNHFIIMEWIDGESLNQLIPANGFAVATAVEYATQIVQGLASAHQQHIIHSDIKPQNIMLTQQGDIKILDFGIARLSQNQTQLAGQTQAKEKRPKEKKQPSNLPLDDAKTSLASVDNLQSARNLESARNLQSAENPETPIATPQNVNGTAGYMSPEQALGVSALDERSDIFAFGIVFYQLLTGKPPFSGKNGREKNAAVITGDYPPLPNTVPEDVRAIVHHCLQQSPAQRYQSSQALADDLQAYTTGEPVSVIHNKGYWLKKKTLKHKWPVMLCVLAMLAGAGHLVWQQVEAANQAFREQLLTRFISRVETLEANVQMSKMAPVHDTTAETALWHQQIQAIKDESEALGEQATGPAGYAIGRMYYALQDYDQALIYLQQAWQSGLTQPRVAYNLALTHGAIYQRQKALIANLNSRSARKDRTAKLDAEHKQPAIKYLNQGLQGSPYYSYTLALLQYYQDDYDTALNTLDNAQDLPTWFYDHHTLKGDIYLAKAEAQGGAHGDDAVEQYAQQAIESYAQAGELGRSDLQLQLKPLNVYFRLLDQDVYGKGQRFEALYKEAETYLTQALILSPQDARPYLIEGQMLTALSEYQDQHSGDPLGTIKTAISQLEKANELLPSNPDILFILASAKRQALYLKLNLQQPVDDDIEAVTALFEQIPDAHRDYYYFNILGLLMSDLSNHYQQQAKLLLLNGYAQDASALSENAFVQSEHATALANKNKNKHQALSAKAQALFTKADVAFGNATRLQPKRIGALINHGSLYRLWAAYQMPKQAKGRLTQAIALYKQARELNPDHFVVNYYLAIGYRFLAQINNQLHQPNLEELAQVKHYYDLANQAQPNHPFLHGLEAFYQADQAIYAWQEAEDYAARLDKIIARLKAKVSEYPKNQSFIDNLAFLQVVKSQINTFEDKQNLLFLKQAMAHSKLASQTRGKPEFILLQLLKGDWQNIAQTEVEQLKLEGVEVLARAEWYSQSGQFAQAEFYFDQVTQYYPSLLWLYRHQHLHRWLKALQTPSNGDIGVNSNNSNSISNTTSNRKSHNSLNKAQQIGTVRTAIAQLEQKLQQYYPKLTIPRYP